MDLFRESICLQLVRELPELVEIDVRPEPKRMRDRLWRGIASGRGALADAGANCSVHRFLKGNPELARAGLRVIGHSTRPALNRRNSTTSADANSSRILLQRQGCAQGTERLLKL